MSRIWMPELLHSGEFTDLTLRCGDNDFKVHRAVVCAQSQVLRAAVKQGFREAETSLIELRDDELDIVKHALHFLYLENYGHLTADSAEDQSTAAKQWICTHIDVYAFADKYDIAHLKILSASKFRKAIKEPGVLSTESLAKFLERIYTTTPSNDRGLRDIISDTCSSLPGLDAHLSHQVFARVVSDVDGVGLDLLLRNQQQRQDFQELQLANHGMAKAISALQITDYCTQCNRPHDGWIMRSGSRLRTNFVIGCKNCNFERLNKERV